MISKYIITLYVILKINICYIITINYFLEVHLRMEIVNIYDFKIDYNNMIWYSFIYHKIHI